MAESSKLTLGYCDIQGRAQQIRWLLYFHKVDFDDKFYTEPADWFDKDKLSLKSDFPNIPYIQDGDVVITETVAALQYAALKTGNKDLLGKNQLDAIKISQLYSFTGDVWMAIIELAANKDFEKIRDEVLESKIAPALEKVSKNLGEKEFPLGYLTWADFFLFDVLDLLRRMKPEFLSKWENLSKYYERINTEELKAYRKSEKYPKYVRYPERTTWNQV